MDKLGDEINGYLTELVDASQKIMPSFLTSDSHHVSIRSADPMNDILSITLDFRISHKALMNYEPVPESITLKPRLSVIE